MGKVFTLICVLFSCFPAESVHINSSKALEENLCHRSNVCGNISIELDSSVKYSMRVGEFCLLNSYCDNSSITIHTNDNKLAVINCASGIHRPTAGIAFINLNVIIKKLRFINCGTYLNKIPRNIVNTFNTSSLYYTSNHAAALLFVNCNLDMTEVELISSFGFATIAINLVNAVINNLNASFSTASFELLSQIGSGVLLHFLDTPKTYPYVENDVKYISIENSIFSENNDWYNNHYTIHYIYNSSISNAAVISAAGLTILYTQNSFTAKVKICNTTFDSNSGLFAGALLIVHYNSTNDDQTYFNNSLLKQKSIFNGRTYLNFIHFTDNTTAHTLSLTPLVIENSKFITTQPQPIPLITNFTSGAVYIHTENILSYCKIKIIFKNTTFFNNYGSHRQACILAENPKTNSDITIILESIHAQNNFVVNPLPLVSFIGIFSFHNIRSLILNGTDSNPSVFINNIGSVIQTVNTQVYLNGNLTFSGNKAANGAAISIDNSRLYFMRDLRVIFKNNQADLFGGAIHAQGLNQGQNCSFYFENINKSISFSHNIAKASGNSVYANPLYHCHLNNSSIIFTPRQALQFIEKEFHFCNDSNNGLLNITTSPSNIKLCDYHDNEIGKIQTRSYPGQTFSLRLAAVDELDRHVYSTIRINIDRIHTRDNYDRTLWLSFDETEQTLQETSHCSNVNMTVHTNNINETDGIITYSLSQIPVVTYSYVYVRPCPNGFILNTNTGSCECSPVLYFLSKHSFVDFHCSIQLQTFSLSSEKLWNAWAGIVKLPNGSRVFGISLNCPHGNCILTTQSELFYSAGNSENDIYKAYYQNGILITVPQCTANREGVLCGKCSEGFSTVFNSNRCFTCSNKSLWIIGLYGVLGPLLIFTLSVLRLTLTAGTLNGIIFYAQISNIGVLDMLHTYSNSEQLGSMGKIVFFFLSFLNLKVGFSLCFYNGMNQLWKSGFHLLFPIYILLIIILLIKVSHYSLWLSNKLAPSSIQVLVTVVHLCFSRFLLAIIDVFTFADVHTSDGSFRVWYWDGTVRYFSREHNILVIVTLIIIAPIVISYITLLLFGKWIQRSRYGNKYCRPILEAIHAPYKEGKEYWFTARIVLLIVSYGVYAVYRATDLFSVYRIIIPILVLFIIIQSFHKPFKRPFINVMDCTLMYNFALLGMTTWYYLVYRKFEIVRLYNQVSIFFVILIFVAVLIYHALWVTGKIEKLNTKYRTLWNKVETFMQNQTRSQDVHGIVSRDYSFYDSDDGYREPLLAPS